MERCAHVGACETGGRPSPDSYSDYRCDTCGDSWRQYWDRKGQPSEPLTDPFEGEQGNCLHGMGPEAMPAFKPGDKVRGRHSKREFRVEFGPYSTESMYAVTSKEGLGYGIRVVDLEPIPPADPRVDVVAAALARENDGYRDPVPAHEIELWASSARAVLAALDAMEGE